MKLHREIEKILQQAGALRSAACRCEPIEEKSFRFFTDWLAAGKAADMNYLSNYLDIRKDPKLLLEGAESIICCAFSFRPQIWRDESLPRIAMYAYGDDYHDVLRTHLNSAVEKLRNRMGGEWRICIDTAPVLERYHAIRSGLGIRGRNGMVIIPAHGSYCFLAEIVTTIPIQLLTASDPCSGIHTLPASEQNPAKDTLSHEHFDATIACIDCGRCVEACPGGALSGDGTLDSNRCISYLSIEHRGDWEGEGLAVMQTPAGRHTLYGCDICLRVCPHNQPKNELQPLSATLPEFKLREDYALLTKERVANLTQEEFSTLFRRSAIKRAKLAGLHRNTRH